MEPVDFYRLPRTAQERFVGSVNGSGLPAPIVAAPFRPVQPLVWGAVSGVALVLVIALAVLGYGDVTSGLVHQGAVLGAVEVGLAALAAFGVLRAMAIRHDHARSPFRRGVYLFPVGLIDARTPTLRVHAIETLSGVFGPDVRGLVLDFGGTPFAFPVTDEAAAASVRAEIEGARGSVGEATAARESIRPKALAALDPLQGYANPLVASAALTRNVPPWATFGWAAALAFGVVFGGSLWMVRNAKSDDATFARAAAANDTASYKAYLEKGTRHAAEVSAVLLPRAELAEAVAVGTVDAIEAFLATHQEPAVRAPGTLALKAALLRELDDASKAGTLAALDAFAKRRPSAGLATQLAAARHAVYQAALERYVQAAPVKAPPTAFIERLLAWSEAKGPRVEVRFHRLHSKTLDKADAAVGRNAQFRGVVSLPSRYFDDAAGQADLATLAASVTARFAGVFPPEIVSVVVGAPLTDPETPLPPQVDVPTLFVEYDAVWAGSIEASRKPRGVFVGLELTYDGLFRLPDAAVKPIKVRSNGWHAPNLTVAEGSEQPEDLVYRDMRQKALAPFQKKLLATLFKDAP